MINLKETDHNILLQNGYNFRELFYHPKLFNSQFIIIGNNFGIDQDYSILSLNQVLSGLGLLQLNLDSFHRKRIKTYTLNTIKGREDPICRKMIIELIKVLKL